MKKKLKFWGIGLIIICLVITPVLYFRCPISMKTTVFTINGRKVSMQEYCYIYNQYKYSIGDDEAWNKQATQLDKEQLRISTVAVLKRQVAIEQFLDSQGIVLTDSDKAYIDEFCESQISLEESKEDWIEWLHENYLTEELYREGVALQVRSNRYVYQKNSEIAENVYRAKHILLKSTDGKYSDLVEIEDKINEIYEQLKNGADFDALMNEHCEDTGVKTEPDGYYFVEGQMVQEFEDATKALEFGEFSEPIESTYGYHIILRLEPDEDDIIHKLDEIYDTATSKYFTDFNAEYEEFMINSEIKYNYFVYFRINPRTVVFKDKSK